MYREYVLKRIAYGLLMYVVMIFIYSTLFNGSVDITMRSQIDEQIAQEVTKLRGLTEAQLKAVVAQRRADKYQQYHLDDPLVSRIFWRSVRTLAFDFGNSTTIKASNGDRLVTGIIMEALPRTLILFTTEVALTTVIGVAMGLYAARKPNGALDRAVSIVTMVTNGLPGWWLGMIAIMAFSYAIPIFPSGGLHVNPAPEGLAGLVDFLWHLSLPLLSLVLLSVWGTAYLTRNIVLSSLQEDYVMAARARGIPERRVLFGHTLRSAMPAIMTLAVLGLFSSIAGNIIIEGIFGWPGIGNLYFIAVEQNDVPVLMGTLAIETLFNMVGFILLDLVYGLLDPRIKAGGEGRVRSRDALRALGEFWAEFSKVKSGLVGLGLLVAFAALGIAGPALVPFPGAAEHWRDIAFWQDNPQAAPPAWTNWFASKKGASSELLASYRSEGGAGGGAAAGGGSGRRSLSFGYRYLADKPPRDMVARFRGSGRLSLTLELRRPDGLTAALYESQVELAEGEQQRVSIARNCAQAAVAFVALHDEYLASTMSADLVDPMRVLFSALSGAEGESAPPLKGDYALVLSAEPLGGAATLGEASVVVAGEVSGLLGTDTSKRDLFTGVVIGVRWALVIGLLTSLITVVVGVLFGVVAAYYGGAVDWLLTRLYELVYLMPVLPFLIVIAAIFKPSIWIMIVMICLFFWVGPYKPVYSMALQIKEETYVEASRALGSSRARIVLRHIIPILLPYSFAVMALSIPGVIVYESSVSLLGLGDATKVTWGQVLHDALAKGAVINNLWWWVVPPGLMIALMGMSFAFLGTALDKILHPKLRTR